MAEEKRKEFGRRGAAPAVVTHAPQGLTGGPFGPSTLRKRSLTVSLVAMGSLALGGYAVIEALDRRANCDPGQTNPNQSPCTSSGTHTGSGGHSGSGRWWWHSGTSSSGSSSWHGVSFGGFGGFGAAHGGGS